MKKGIAILLSLLIAGGALAGCGSKKAEANIDDIPTISEDEKSNYKEEAEKALEGYKLNSVDILTQTDTLKPIVSVQVFYNGDESNLNKSKVEEFTRTIIDKIKKVSDLYSVSVLNKNNQIIATADYGTGDKVEFAE